MDKLDETTRRIAKLIARYVEHVWPHIERMGGTPDEPMQQAKGSANPPFGDYAHRLIDSNTVPSLYFHWALETTEQSAVKSSDGIYFSAILHDLRYDAGLRERWRDLNGGDNSYNRAFWEMCRHVAKGVVFVYGRTDMERKRLEGLMDLSPDDSGALTVRRVPSDELEGRGRTRQGQKIDTLYTRRLMVEQLEELERSTGYTGLEAMEILSERKAKEGKDWSIPRLRKAREIVNREKEVS